MFEMQERRKNTKGINKLIRRKRTDNIIARNEIEHTTNDSLQDISYLHLRLSNTNPT